MKQFLTVLKFELNNYFKNKSFIITTVLLAVIVAGAVIVPTMIPGLLGGDKKENSVEYAEGSAEEEEDLDSLGIFVNTDEVKDVDRLLSMMPARWTSYEDGSSLKGAVMSGEIQEGFIINSAGEVTYVVMNLGLEDWISREFQEVLAIYQKQEYLMDKGLTVEEIQASEMKVPTMVPEILGKNSGRNYAYTYVLVFAVYFLILFYGQMIAVSVTTEKSNRAIEILVTSVNPNSLIFGKVLAGAIAGVLQMVIILGSGFAAYSGFADAWGGKLDFLFHIPGRVLVSFAFFAAMSYLLYAFIFGMLGALVSKTEDISKSATPVTIIYVVSFLIAMLGLNDCDSMMIKVASYIPFTSGNAMFIRISMGSVALWEILLSGAILAASCVITGLLAARLFRMGTLHYGNPVKFTKALKIVREK